ncbi:hypothetical protein JVU11DRAFT_6030 [Chiua virens]|nr:hypothetical protein JVU11DRAFT_6030 [Chiua virens]
MVRDDNYEGRTYRWPWSDTCCIDKKNPDIFEKSIRSRYKWYHNSAVTLVRLADPSKSTPRNSPRLGYNRWIFRAWTLQELLAPRNIRFDRHDWELYLTCHTNHKKDPKIMHELQNTMTSVNDILQNDFSPDSLTVRQRLQLASTREASQATKKGDIAYALVGDFSSDIHVDNHHEGDIALGLLLQEIVNRQGDVSVLDWTGQPSKFNSLIPPGSISVYKPESYILPPITDNTVSLRADTSNASLKEEVSGFMIFFIPSVYHVSPIAVSVFLASRFLYQKSHAMPHACPEKASPHTLPRLQHLGKCSLKLKTHIFPSCRTIWRKILRTEE